MTEGLGRRGLLRLGGVGALAAFAAACGSNTGRGGSGSGLTQWYHAYGEAGVRDAVYRYADGYSDTKVHVQWNPGDYDSKIVTALQNNSVPDVFEAQPKVNYVRAKQVVALDDVLGDAREDFLPSALETSSIDGKLYGIPQTVDTQVLFYRKSMLRKAGVRPPATVDELLAAAKRLTAGEVKGLFVGNDGGVQTLAGPLLWSAGLDYLRRDGNRHRIGFDVSGAGAAYAKLHELNASESLLLGAPADWSDPSAFTSGQVAMQWTGLWNMPQIAARFGDDFGVLPFPKLHAGGEPSVPIGCYGSMVNAKSEHLGEAKRFVRWLWVEQTGKQLEFATRYGLHIPARKSLIAEAKRLRSGPAAEVSGFVERHSHLVGGPYWTPAMKTALDDAVTEIVKNGGDPAARLRPAVGAIERELRRLS